MIRYPVAPLLHTIEHRYPEKSDEERSLALGYEARWLGNIRQKPTLREDAADRAAIAVGCHPAELWPSWFDDAIDTRDDPTPDPRCGTRAGHQAHYRRGEAPCLACRIVDRERKAEAAARKKAAAA